MLGTFGWTELVIVAVFYFMPTHVALIRKTPDRRKVFLVNLLLGWTVIGWFFAAIMALKG